MERQLANLVVPKMEKTLAGNGETEKGGLCNLENMKFPSKLWHIATHDETGSVWWSTDGETIVIDIPQFEENYLKTRQFKTEQFGSLVRQLNLYSFVQVGRTIKIRSTEGSGQVFAQLRMYRSPLFKRDRPDLLRRMKRGLGSQKAAAANAPSMVAANGNGRAASGFANGNGLSPSPKRLPPGRKRAHRSDVNSASTATSDNYRTAAGDNYSGCLRPYRNVSFGEDAASLLAQSFLMDSSRLLTDSAKAASFGFSHPNIPFSTSIADVVDSVALSRQASAYYAAALQMTRSSLLGGAVPGYSSRPESAAAAPPSNNRSNGGGGMVVAQSAKIDETIDRLLASTVGTPPTPNSDADYASSPTSSMDLSAKSPTSSMNGSTGPSRHSVSPVSWHSSRRKTTQPRHIATGHPPNANGSGHSHADPGLDHARHNGNGSAFSKVAASRQSSTLLMTGGRD